jgi:hypothetical protein
MLPLNDTVFISGGIIIYEKAIAASIAVCMLIASVAFSHAQMKVHLKQCLRLRSRGCKKVLLR